MTLARAMIAFFNRPGFFNSPGRPAARRMQRLTRWLCAGAMMASLAACATVFRNHGYAPTDFELDQVQVGKDTHETVAELVGRPTAAGLLNDTGWYYVQSRWQHFGARAPKEIERQVVAISFTEAGIVENVERFGLEQGRVVPLSRRVTETNIKGISLIGQLLGNFGNVRAQDILQ
ncbi:MAG: outer membrane protein assembly factor BamE [Paracoccaceae bacterium]|nr:outer membrane protein assembly factor BamE [Paracoccaceae bacterium]